MDPYLLKHLKDAWRGELTARRHVLAWLRAQGHAGLAAALEPALGPSVVYQDAWTLDQLVLACALTEADLDADHMEAVGELLRQIEENDAAFELEPASRKLRYDLCGDCRKRYLRDPLGRESAPKCQFSKN